MEWKSLSRRGKLLALGTVLLLILNKNKSYMNKYPVLNSFRGNFMRSRNLEENMAEDRHLWNLGVMDGSWLYNNKKNFLVNFDLRIMIIYNNRFFICWCDLPHDSMTSYSIPMYLVFPCLFLIKTWNIKNKSFLPGEYIYPSSIQSKQWIFR